MIIQGTETLTSLIHIIAESLLTPVIIFLIIFLVVVILSTGSFINEAISRKAISSKEIENLIKSIYHSNPNEIKDHTEKSNLFNYQKEVIIKLADNYDIGPESRKALASKLIEEEELRLVKSTNMTDILIRVAPILGLLGTLIPLGPGLAALGNGDINTLSQSLIIAFDTTTLGLAIGGIAFLISKLKKQWYEGDLSTLEAICEGTLESLNKRWLFLLRKRKKLLSNDNEDDPIAGIPNLADAMLVLALGFLVFAIMSLSVNPDMVDSMTQSKQVVTGESFSDNSTQNLEGIEEDGSNEVGKVYKDPETGELILVSN